MIYEEDGINFTIDVVFDEATSFSMIDFIPIAKGLGESEWTTSFGISNIIYHFSKNFDYC